MQSHLNLFVLWKSVQWKAYFTEGYKLNFVYIFYIFTSYDKIRYIRQNYIEL